MTTFIFYYAIALVFINAHSLRLFMIGGNTQDDSALYNDLAAAVQDRQPTPGRCGTDWSQTDCPRIAVITSSQETEAKGNYSYSVDTDDDMSYATLFLSFGMSPRHISVHADNYEQTANTTTARGQANLEVILAADILFFGGGDQSKHIRAWLNDDGQDNQLLEVIKNLAMNDDIIIAGSSAGSMLFNSNVFGEGSVFGVAYFANSVGLAPKIVSDAAVGGSNLVDTRNGTDCLQYKQNAGKMQGFNWVDFTFDVHFNSYGRMGRLVPIMSELKIKVGLGIDENTSFFYENGQGKVFGQHGVTIFDISDAVKLQSKFFQFTNIKVHYLTEGDRYDFKSNTITTSKPLITTPQFKSNTDSENIFGPNESSLLLTRLVDQTAVLNRGKSTVPNGYPEDAPVFEITFSKNAQTKGYRRGDAYTVVNAVMDYSYISFGKKTAQLSTQ